MSETRLSEVDKLLNKINFIYTAIKGKDENGKKYKYITIN
jgi:hypothetical protein